MSINQISLANTFGQLVTAVSGLIAVSNNFTDGPAVVTNANWTFSNDNVGINVGNTALITTANVGTLNLSTGNVSNITVGNANASMANITVANIGGATIANVFSTRVTTTNANVNFIQVDDRANIFSLNAESANIGTLSLTTLNVSSLTVPVLNTSFANITDASVTGTFQAISLTATLATVTNANVTLLNSSAANITGATVGTLNVSYANVTSLNVGSLNLTLSNTTTVNVGSVLNTPFANAVLANIITLNTSTANISNLTVVQINASIANLTTGTMAANPTVNLGIATKNYADTGAGGNLVSKITFNAKGDLILGTGANTFSAHPTSTNGNVLVVDTQTSTGVRWTNRPTQSFRGLNLITSSKDKVANGTQLVVKTLDEVVMDDGEVVTGWTPDSVIDLSVSGAGGLDGGTANANTWYEVYAIRKRSDGTKNFILHRALDRKPDQNTMNGVQWATGTYGSVGANSTITLSNVKVAMSFTPNVSGPLTSIEIRGFKTSTPTGNIWLTLEANTATNPSGTALATSRKYDVSRVGLTTHYPMRFIFDTTANVVSGTSYFWVFNSDYVGSATAFMNVSYSTQAANGQGGVNPGVPKGNNGTSWVDLTPGIGTFIYKVYIESNSVAVTMPTGYDQKCLISYTMTDSANKLKEYRQRDRMLSMYYSSQWAGYQSIQTTTPEVADHSLNVPPITCEVSFLPFQTNGVTSYCGFGLVDCLDVPGTAYVETRGFIPCSAPSTGSIASPSTPFIYVEQQVTMVHVGVAVTKFYVSNILI